MRSVYSLAGVLPVAAREARAVARRPALYWQRSLAVGAVLLAVVAAGHDGWFFVNQGGALFSFLHAMLLALVWMGVPLLTADCLSRERREGTLGLLFLTPLRPWQVVTAKGLAHGLRALTLGLAVAPLLMIPLLLGGVRWEEVVTSVHILACSFAWALAAGLLASALCQRRHVAFTLAVILAAAFLALLSGLQWLAFSFWLSNLDELFAGAQRLLQCVILGFRWLANLQESWRDLFDNLPLTGTKARWSKALLQTAAVSLLVLMLGVGLAARLIRRRWQEPTPSKAQLWLTDIFCTPAYGVGLYHRWLRWELTRNPVGWLELRRWSSRLLSWIWTAVTMSVFIFSLTAVNAGVISWRDVGIFSFLMYWLLLGCVALAAAGSFGRERASGVMELLLVTPLNERRILRGRLRGLWGQFLPAIVLLVILQHLLAFYREHQYFNLDLVRGWFLALACFMLPVIGLYYSLACRHFFSALGWTLVVGLGLPQLVNVLAKGGISLVVVGSWDGYYWAPARYFHYHPVLVFMAGGGLGLFVQLLLAVHLGRRLHRRLVQRDFVFQA